MTRHFTSHILLFTLILLLFCSCSSKHYDVNLIEKNNFIPRTLDSYPHIKAKNNPSDSISNEFCEGGIEINTHTLESQIKPKVAKLPVSQRPLKNLKSVVAVAKQFRALKTHKGLASLRGGIADIEPIRLAFLCLIVGLLLCLIGGLYSTLIVEQAIVYGLIILGAALILVAWIIFNYEGYGWGFNNMCLF